MASAPYLPPKPGAGAVTALISRLGQDRAGAAEELFPLVYAELRALAGAAFRGVGAAHTLQPTAIVHEVYLRLAGDRGSIQDREHFFALAATAMRQLLIDHARRKDALKRGGDRDRISLDTTEAAAAGSPAPTAAELVDALEELERSSKRQARVVELRYLGGLSVAEVARVLDVSERTVKSEWRFARAWLRSRLDPTA